MALFKPQKWASGAQNVFNSQMKHTPHRMLHSFEFFDSAVKHQPVSLLFALYVGRPWGNSYLHPVNNLPRTARQQDNESSNKPIDIWRANSVRVGRMQLIY